MPRAHGWTCFSSVFFDSCAALSRLRSSLKAFLKLPIESLMACFSLATRMVRLSSDSSSTEDRRGVEAMRGMARLKMSSRVAS